MTLEVYTLAGERIRTLLTGPVDAGVHSVTWDGLADNGRQAPTGAYFVKLGWENKTVNRKILLFR